MIFITHDLSVLVETCDRLAIMYAGRIVETGPAEKVFYEPAHPYTEALAAAFPEIGDRRFRGSPSGLPGDPPYPSDLPSGCTFHPRCPKVFDACPTVDPRLYDVSAGRQAACLLVEGAKAARVTGAGSGEGASWSVEPAPDEGPILDVDDIHVTFAGRVGLGAGLLGKKATEARAVDGVVPRPAQGRDPRARRGVRLRQDDDRQGDHGPRTATAGLDHLQGGADLGRPAGVPAPRADGVPGPDRSAQPPSDGLRVRRRGPADPPRARRREGAGGSRARERRHAPARAVLPQLPARALGRTAAAHRDRRRTRAGTRHDRRRRARVEPRRVGPRGDPRPVDGAPPAVGTARSWSSPTTWDSRGRSPTASP